jgi:hypothetical protein
MVNLNDCVSAQSADSNRQAMIRTNAVRCITRPITPMVIAPVSVRNASSMSMHQRTPSTAASSLPSFASMMTTVSQTMLMRPSSVISSSVVPLQRRHFMCTFGDVKVGWIIKYENRLLQVVKMSRAQYQQREPVIAVCYYICSRTLL